jgi:uncharacterized membrane protein
LGVAITMFGVVGALIAFARRALRPAEPPIDAYREMRRNVGRSILLGLELLVAGDIIRTVAPCGYNSMSYRGSTSWSRRSG